MSSREFDLVVIGGGSGGLAASKRAASHGAQVALIEASRLGGTCVIRGCIPKKLMVYAAKLGAERQLAQDYGWTGTLGPIDWPKLQTFRDKAVDRLERIHEANLSKAGVKLFKGHACFVDPQTVEVGETRLKAKKFIVATGSTPSMPPLPGIEFAKSSNGLWALKEKPESVTIIGGGYIAVEFASLLHNLGCQTSLVVRSSLLRDFDHALGAHLTNGLKQQGIAVHTNTRPLKIEPSGEQTKVVATHRDTTISIQSDSTVLLATGRHPNTKDLGLENVGIQTNPDGSIPVNANHATTARHIFALGDVLGHSMLTPVAIKAGRNVADREFGESSEAMSYECIPTAVFSIPPVGAVGFTEETAVEQFGAEDIQTYQARFTPLLYSPATPEQKRQTLMKLVVQKSSDRVLGFHMVGDDAPEIIQGFAAALVAGITKSKLNSTLAIHPTAAEEFVLMG